MTHPPRSDFRGFVPKRDRRDPARYWLTVTNGRRATDPKVETGRPAGPGGGGLEASHVARGTAAAAATCDGRHFSKARRSPA